MRFVDPGATFESWRAAARSLLQAEVPPEEIMWDATSSSIGQLFELEPQATLKTADKSNRVPLEFFTLARAVSCHIDPAKWAILYRLLWRITHGKRQLLKIASDPDVAPARQMEKAVRREIHKAHAFVRFRLLGESDTGREYFTAWFEPDHHIVRPMTPFFVKRFANMDWSIFTPKGSVHWKDEKLHYSEPVEHDPFEGDDRLEELWKTYYGHIFNPSRLMLKAMRKEMPERYWKNMPETVLISELIQKSGTRVSDMLSKQPNPPKRPGRLKADASPPQP